MKKNDRAVVPKEKKIRRVRKAAPKGVCSDVYDQLPKPVAENDWDRPVIIPPRATESTKGKLLVIGDFHIPYHDNRAITTMLSFVQQYHKDIRSVLINGDFYDLDQVSRFASATTSLPIEDEIAMGNQVRDVIKRELSFVDDWYFKVGNHDVRFQLYVNSHAPLLAKIKGFDFSNIAGIIDSGFTFVDSMQYTIFSGMTIMHGHEVLAGRAAPVSPSRTAFLHTMCDVMVGHAHTRSMHEKRVLRGDNIKAYSHGCLRSLSPSYRPVNNWQLGFAVIESLGKVKGTWRSIVYNYGMEESDDGSYHVYL